MNETARLIAACLTRDGSAERQLYELYHRRVYRLAARMVGPQEAPDLTQEVFLRVFAGLGTFRGNAEFSTWVYRVAVNECLRYLRGRSTRDRTSTTDPICPGPGPGHRLEQAELLQQVLSPLDGQLKAVVLLREAEGLSYDQIASVLEIPPGTVASQLNRARAELRSLVQKIERRLTDR